MTASTLLKRLIGGSADAGAVATGVLNESEHVPAEGSAEAGATATGVLERALPGGSVVLR